MNKVFSICIPTYKRAEYLDKCLASFIDEAIRFEIPVYISNNAGCKKTVDIIEKYKSRHPLIFYKNQNDTIKLDLNMLEALKLSQTEYALWLGDDDTLKPDSISNILKYLNKTPDLLLLKISDEQNLKEIYQTPFKFFDDYGMIGRDFAMHFSSLVVKVKDVIGNPDILRFKGTYHLYAGAIFDYLLALYKKNGKSRILSTQKICVRLGTAPKTWKNSVIPMYIKHIPDWLALFDIDYKNNTLFINKVKEYFDNIILEGILPGGGGGFPSWLKILSVNS